MNMISNLSNENGCVVLFFSVLLEQAGLPIPAAPFLVAAGTACAAGESSLGMVIGTTILASLIADLAWFYAGRRGGERVVHLLCRLAGAGCGDQAGRAFRLYGMPGVVLAKFVPGLGVLAPPLAGALDVRVGRFLLFDALGSALYGALYLLLGLVFSEQVVALLELWEQCGKYSAVVLMALLLVWIVLKLVPRKRAA